MERLKNSKWQIGDRIIIILKNGEWKRGQVSHFSKRRQEFALSKSIKQFMHVNYNEIDRIINDAVLIRENGEKFCVKCGEVKSVNEFYRDSTLRYLSYCKACQKGHMTDAYMKRKFNVTAEEQEANRERDINEMAKEYNKSHPFDYDFVALNAMVLNRALSGPNGGFNQELGGGKVGKVTLKEYRNRVLSMWRNGKHSPLRDVEVAY